MKKRLWSWAAICSVGTAFALSGCGNAARPVVNEDPPIIGHAESDEHGHDHPTEGPHHGHLIELGKEDYHAELVDDEATGTVTIYVLDAAAKEQVPIEAKELVVNISSGSKPAQYTLEAAPDVNDPEPKCSRFTLSSKELCDRVCASDAKGRVNININGKNYSGAIEHVAHAGHEHKH